MSSPFTLFRRHQRILMVIVTGLAMISFVLLGAVSDPREMPPALVIAALAAMVGGVGWIMGLNTGKASEWGITGLAVGAVLGLAMNMLNRTPDVVQMSSGNLSPEQFSNLRRERSLANSFVQLASSVNGSTNPFMRDLNLFGFDRFNKGGEGVQQAVLDEILRREADNLGINISDEAVFEFINKLTQEKLTRDQFKEIREQLGASENELVSALRNELKVKEALRILYPDQYAWAYPKLRELFMPAPAAVPPAEFWDYYKKLNVRQSAEIVEVPVAAFVDEAAKPTEAERAELFEQFRNNAPLRDAEGQFQEGLIGFRQPPRAKLAYLEAVPETFEKMVPPVTEEEIQAQYELRYLRTVPEGPDSESLDSPLLPDLPGTAPSGSSSAPPVETPPASTPVQTPGKEDAGSTDTPPAAPAEPASPPAENPPASETPANPPAEAAPEEKPTEGSSSGILRSGLIPVAFLTDDPAPAAEAPSATPSETPADAPAGVKPETTPAPLTAPADAPTDSPKTETPPAVPAAEPAPGATPAAEGTPATMPTDNIPPPPSGPRPLDDELKATIRQELLKIRTQAEISKRIVAASEYMQDLATRTHLGPEEKNYIKKEDLADLLSKYAEEQGLEYIETDWLSYEEMRDSEDYPLGKALDTSGPRPVPVSDRLFGSTVSLYIPSVAANFETSSSFSYWKIDEKEPGVPETLDDPKVIAQVDEAWRMQKAMTQAKARAEELVKLLSADQSAATELLGETTVTGKAGSVYLTVTETGEFSWRSQPSVPPTSMNAQQSVTVTKVPGAPKAWNRFMKTVFEDLKPGETGIAPAFDDSSLYVVRVKSRYPASDEELEQLRKSFIAAGTPTSYTALANESRAEFSGSWVDELWKKHDVQLAEVLQE